MDVHPKGKTKTNETRPYRCAHLTTHARTHARTGLEEEVVGVAEGELLAGLVAPVVVHRLERPVGRHGHEARRVDDAVRRVDAAHPAISYWLTTRVCWDTR